MDVWRDWLAMLKDLVLLQWKNEIPDETRKHPDCLALAMDMPVALHSTVWEIHLEDNL